MQGEIGNQTELKQLSEYIEFEPGETVPESEELQELKEPAQHESLETMSLYGDANVEQRF